MNKYRNCFVRWTNALLLQSIVTLSLCVGVTCAAMAQSARSFKINEVMVKNTEGPIDEHGERSGWIEIANTSHGTSVLGSSYLTSDKSVLDEHMPVAERIRKMSLIPREDPRTTVAAKQLLLFFADGLPNRGALHLNFTLTEDEPNWIALYDGDGKTLLDSVTVPASLSYDESYARLYDPSADTYIYKVLQAERVTPNMENASDSLAQDKPAIWKEKDPHGIGMSIIAMSIVFVALLLLYLFFRFQGKIVVALKNRKPAGKGQPSPEESTAIALAFANDEEEVAVAIALALAEAFATVHDIESDIITLTAPSTAWSVKSFKRI